jgi:glycosyltransferase involved in cell wall biosynthesis
MKFPDKIIFVALSVWDTGYSGGDRILIELSRSFQKMHKQVTIVTWQRGADLARREDLPESIRVINYGLKRHLKLGFLIHYAVRIITSIYAAFSLKISDPQNTLVYSSSEFLMDSLPGFILKLRYPESKWITAWYQTAPNPISGYAEGNRKGNRYRFQALIYWLMQQMAKPMIRIKSDLVIVNNNEEIRQFQQTGNPKKVYVILGGLDVNKIRSYVETHKTVNKTYDAVFQGRFHPQKGVTELVEIWSRVVKILPKAKLAMIGDGPLMGEVQSLINKHKLAENIDLLGYLFDGDKKYSVFNRSKIVVHPALYDSGGMASGEAMAFGLPCIAFDLKSYASYYPEGMVKIEPGNLDNFSKAIIEMLHNNKKIKYLGDIAKFSVMNNWSWDIKAKHLLEYFPLR